MENARLGAIALDCHDPIALANFYKDVLDLSVALSTDELVVLKGAEVFLTFERVADHPAPTWPEGAVPKQLHLDLAVTDLDAEEARIVALGATKAETQPRPDQWRVLIDPAGHPFCITTMM
ncbi:VOC family protein [Mycolicibacterium setense]|uniref:VOC family protein n=1 Tax=Mycolicibacterium setense TaxID=431269 RepID=UPI000573D5BB|nr:VOC family protein [Mycolicibacterium setense]KHO22093.1 glyoxalase [Mycolicibacterium setense]MCV7113667.1 VOC family protein [Mycolicibacterium setense]